MAEPTPQSNYKHFKALQERVTKLAGELRTSLTALEARVSTLEARSEPALADLAPLEARLDALERGETDPVAVHVSLADPHGDRAYTDKRISEALGG